jgi:hypothetical protein
MEPKAYAMLLVDYTGRFGELPPSILTEEGAGMLMERALRRDTPIGAADLRSSFGGAPPVPSSNARFG